MIKYIIVILFILSIFGCGPIELPVDKRKLEEQHLKELVDKSYNECINKRKEDKHKVCDEYKHVRFEDIHIEEPKKDKVTFWKPNCNPWWTFDDDGCMNPCYPLFNCY